MVRPAFQALYAFRRLRGSALDPFGYAEVGRVEGGLVDEYLRQVEAVLGRLGPETDDAAVALGNCPTRSAATSR